MHESLGIWCDPADAADASYEHHPIDDIEPMDDSRSVGLIEKMLQILQAHDRCYIIDCLLLCMPSGLAYMEGMSMTEVASRYGVTKAAVSKKCRELRVYLNFPESNFMRKEREIFIKTNMPRCKNL